MADYKEGDGCPIDDIQSCWLTVLLIVIFEMTRLVSSPPSSAGLIYILIKKHFTFYETHNLVVNKADRQS